MPIGYNAVFDALRKNYVALALKHARIAVLDIQSISLGSGHEIRDTGPTVAPTESAKDELLTDIEGLEVNWTETSSVKEEKVRLHHERETLDPKYCFTLSL